MKKERRESTIIRDNMVHDMYNQLLSDLGALKGAVSKGYLYDRIKEKTRLSIRTISFILNHTHKKELQ